MGGCSAHQQRLSEDCAAALLGGEWSHHCLCDKHMGKRAKELEERAQTTAAEVGSESVGGGEAAFLAGSAAWVGPAPRPAARHTKG